MTRLPGTNRAVRAVAAALLLVLVFASAAWAAPPPTERYFGGDRIQTAIAVSQNAWASSAEVVLARSNDFPDALAGGPLAGSRSSPLLLNPQAALDRRVIDELERLRPTTVTLLGGPSALSLAVEQGLRDLGYQVTRLQGADRFETAASLFGDRKPPPEVILASGRAFPDALAAGGLLPAQVLLTERDQIPAATLDVLRKTSVTDVLIVGGTSAVSAAIETQLRDQEGKRVRRLAGTNRYDTGLAVLGEAITRRPERGPLLVATGANFPDALGAGPLAARRRAPLLLTPSDDITDGIAQFLADNACRFGGLTVLGGEKAVSPRVVTQIQDVIDLGQSTSNCG